MYIETFTTPVIKPKRPQSAYHRKPKTTYNGLIFLHGNGCKKWNDCLNCPLKKCTWTTGSAKPDES